MIKHLIHNLNKSSYLTAYLFNIFFTLILLIPVIIKSDFLFGRNNDLQEFFWPLYHFSKDQIINHSTFPLWNNLILSGYPLISDPQSPLFYFPNIIFLFLQINMAFLLSFIFHITLGGFGMYLCSKKIFNFSFKTSIIASAIYIFTPRLASFLEAGHVGQIYSFAWIPFVFLSTYQIFSTKKVNWVAIYTLSLSSILLTHTITFLVALSFSILFFFFLIIYFKRIEFKSIIIFIGSIFLTISLTSIVLIPQLEWSKITTRNLLTINPEVYPLWSSLYDFYAMSTNPLLFNPTNTSLSDTEKWIPLGLISIIIASLGFIYLKKGTKIVVFTVCSFIVFISINNLSPFYNLLLKQNFYDLFRVTTRIWIILIFIIIFLSAYFFEKIKNSKIFFLLSLIMITELISLSYFKLTTPIQKPVGLAPLQIYELLSSDQDQFRIFCTSKCFSQKLTSLYNLETIEGYNTLQQLNYYKHSWELTKSYWNYYTLSIPPFGIAKHTKIQPSANSLGEYNVKYVVSPHPLTDPNFKLIANHQGFSVYKNNLYKPRAYFLNGQKFSEAKIIYYSSNKIKVSTKNNTSNNLVLSEVYSPGWEAYANGNKKIEILESPISLRSIKIPKDTDFVILKYNPLGFKFGIMISIASIIFISSIFLFKYERFKYE